MDFRRIAASTFLASLLAMLLALSVVAQSNECQGIGAPCVAYIAGGGGATDAGIERRVASY